jgi:hypothetical protein
LINGILYLVVDVHPELEKVILDLLQLEEDAANSFKFLFKDGAEVHVIINQRNQGVLNDI